MDGGAHPHMGLQTVTWLLDGELAHYDLLAPSLIKCANPNPVS
jgi:redox-sensitive bicupin YhaK (pirin superfamily)